MTARTTGPAAAPTTAPKASQSGLNTLTSLPTYGRRATPGSYRSEVARGAVRVCANWRARHTINFDERRRRAEGVDGGWRGRFRGVRPVEARGAGPVGLSADRRSASGRGSRAVGARADPPVVVAPDRSGQRRGVHPQGDVSPAGFVVAAQPGGRVGDR